MSATHHTATSDYLIDLPTALRLAGAQNLDVQLARERLAEAQALHDSVLLQFFPWVGAGISYRRHDGRIQDTSGDILDVNKQASAPGAALVGQWELGDAIYRKLAAKQLEHAANHALEAQRQDSVLAAARDYFGLAFAQAAVGVARDAVRISTHYEVQVQAAVEAGLAFKGDALRVSVQAERNQLALRQATEQQRVAAARLAQTLHLDPSVELVARDTDLSPLTLIESNAALHSLVQQALLARPELKQGQALVEAACENKNGTVYGPLIPSIGASAFGGGLGGGRAGDTDNFGDQQDYSIGVGWRIGPGGIFDFSRQRAAKSRLNSARLSADKAHDEITRQVVEAYTRSQSQSEQIEMARRGLAAAEEGLGLAQQRQVFGVGVVLENILAEQDLTKARNDYLKSIAEFNKAQYALSKAVGQLPSP
ncbi:MAG: TolC family protein [Chloroflexi bacterium]|nr:TolC family protein [Chloroflexota bacterium]